MPNTGNLKHFNTETARAAGKKSAETKRARKALATRQATELARHLDAAIATFQREQLGPAAAATAAQLLSRVLTGDIPVRNGDEAAALLRVMVDVARLESGEATSHTLHATISTAEAVKRVQELQRQARATIEATTSSHVDEASAAAQAVDDRAPAGASDDGQEEPAQVSPEATTEPPV